MKRGGPTQHSPVHAFIMWMAIGSFAVGTIVRVFAAHNDLWFDEVWTFQLLRERVRSFDDVFTNLKHSNNHHLCSLWMWFVGQDASALVYRLPSVLTSIGTVVLAERIGAADRLDGCRRCDPHVLVLSIDSFWYGSSWSFGLAISTKKNPKNVLPCLRELLERRNSSSLGRIYANT
jgi:hypothetical protein